MTADVHRELAAAWDRLIAADIISEHADLDGALPILLPLIAAAEMRAAAQELRDAACALAEDQHVDIDYVPDVLRDRADALDSSGAADEAARR